LPAKAIDRKTGARGLRSIMETILLDTMSMSSSRPPARRSPSAFGVTFFSDPVAAFAHHAAPLPVDHGRYRERSRRAGRLLARLFVTHCVDLLRDFAAMRHAAIPNL